MVSPRQIFRDWSLPIAMIGGVLIYFAYVNIPFFDDTHAAANRIIIIGSANCSINLRKIDFPFAASKRFFPFSSSLF